MTQLENMAAQKGTAAPDFELPDQFGEQTTLSDLLRDGPVALVFFPLAFSGICRGELCEIRENLGVFQRRNVRVVAVSVDSKFTLQAWAKEQRFDFKLLSDFWPHGEVAQKYGIFFSELGVANRAAFIIGGDGIIKETIVTDPGTPRDFSRYEAAIEQLEN